jgi:hypothetical protein
VVLAAPNLYFGEAGVPAQSGYRIAAIGNVAGPAGLTHVQLDCAGSWNEFAPVESYGSAQWVVELKGDFSGCGRP